MRVITAACKRFVEPLALLCDQCERFGLPVTVYDLNDLGRGIPWRVSDSTFRARGRYEKIDGVSPTAMHKPGMILDAMTRFDGETLVYLDADAIPIADPREAGFDADVGLTLRPECERQVNHDGRDVIRRRWQGMFNAGVMFFDGTISARRLVQAWSDSMDNRGDQFAMNELVNPECDMIGEGDRWNVLGAEVQAIGEPWNCRSWPPREGAKVAHLIGGRYKKHTHKVRSICDERWHGSQKEEA